MISQNNVFESSRSTEPNSPVVPVWKPDLYRIQQEAPRARAVLCQCPTIESPPEYGAVFHGALSHTQAATVLTHDGDYLVRLSSNIYTLSLRYERSPAFLTLNRLKKKAQQQNEAAVDYDKSHSFKIHTFKGLNWCEFCGNFLWGFIAQGVKCDDCGFCAHAKCSEKLPSDCCPDMKNLRGVFGVDLTTLVKAHHTVRPFVVDKCVQEIEARGLRTEGLYRVSGFADEMDSLRLALDREGESADMSVNVYENISVVAGILKLYLRLLPLPLITYEAHPLVIRAIQQPNQRQQVAAVKDALTLLPPAHYNTLKYLIYHLTRVVEHEPFNKMTSQNLGTVFAPTLMPPPVLIKCPTVLPDMTNEILALQLLIDHYVQIFT